MQKPKDQSRRVFVKLVAGLGTGLFAWSWYRLSEVQTGKDSLSEFRHNADIRLGVSYFGKYYLIRDEKGIRAFSTTCTHAGCRIGKGSGTLLRCGCHGSQFDAKSGKPVKGPAIKPLQELDCYFDKSSGMWIVKLQPVDRSPVGTTCISTGWRETKPCENNHES
ncbi:MAG: Rieske (2Fe-2S) protein [Prolixibacteraceae bacterium]|jgi:nitrite reductase/ring-hydroxylating ferredoxin subunit|nr:Rieske (2Fe-2S) protein [Prolixibacteraceae bacterium]